MLHILSYEREMKSRHLNQVEERRLDMARDALSKHLHIGTKSINVERCLLQQEIKAVRRALLQDSVDDLMAKVKARTNKKRQDEHEKLRKRVVEYRRDMLNNTIV